MVFARGAVARLRVHGAQPAVGPAAEPPDREAVAMMGRKHISKATPSPDLLLPENEPPAVVFGAALRAARECNGETQGMVAAAIGVSKSAYAKYERGEKEPCLIVLKNIMGHYEVDANYLLPLGTQQHNTANAELNAIYRRLCNTFDRLDVLGKDARIMGLMTCHICDRMCDLLEYMCACVEKDGGSDA